MKKHLHLIFFLTYNLIAQFSFAQKWMPVPNSNILFSDYIDQNLDNREELTEEYFKKGDSLIIIDKDCGKSFFRLLQDNPDLFAKLFSKAPHKSYAPKDKSRLIDSALEQVDFTVAICIRGIEIVVEGKQIQWLVKNYGWYEVESEERLRWIHHPQDLRMVFLKIHKKGMDDCLQLLFIRDEGFEI